MDSPSQPPKLSGTSTTGIPSQQSEEPSQLTADKPTTSGLRAGKRSDKEPLHKRDIRTCKPTTRKQSNPLFRPAKNLRPENIPEGKKEWLWDANTDIGRISKKRRKVIEGEAESYLCISDSDRQLWMNSAVKEGIYEGDSFPDLRGQQELRAARPIMKDSILGHYGGEVFALENMADHLELHGELGVHTYTVQINDDLCVSAVEHGNAMRFINASRTYAEKLRPAHFTTGPVGETPQTNVAILPVIGNGQAVALVLSLKDIQEGESIWLDYGIEFWQTQSHLLSVGSDPQPTAQATQSEASGSDSEYTDDSDETEINTDAEIDSEEERIDETQSDDDSPPVKRPRLGLQSGLSQSWPDFLNERVPTFTGLERDSSAYYHAIQNLFREVEASGKEEFRPVHLTQAGILIPVDGPFCRSATEKWQNAHCHFIRWQISDYKLTFDTDGASRTYLNMLKLLDKWNPEYQELIRCYLFSLLNIPLDATSAQIAMTRDVRVLIQNAYLHLNRNGILYPPKGVFKELDFHATWKTPSVLAFLRHYDVDVVKPASVPVQAGIYEKVLGATHDEEAYFYHLLNVLCSNKFKYAYLVKGLGQAAEKVDTGKRVTFPQVDGLDLTTDSQSVFLASLYAYGFEPHLLEITSKSPRPLFRQALNRISKPKRHPVLYRNLMILYLRHLKGDTDKDLTTIKFKLRNLPHPDSLPWTKDEIRQLRREIPAEYLAPHKDIWKDHPYASTTEPFRDRPFKSRAKRVRPSRQQSAPILQGKPPLPGQ